MTRARVLTVATFVLLAVAAVAWQGWGLPEDWGADEMMWVVRSMLERRSWDPGYFMYPSLMTDVCYALCRLVGAEDPSAVAHVCRSVSAGFYLLGVFCMGRTVEVLLGREVPFAYFFSGTIGAFVHHAHLATVNACLYATVLLAVLAFVRTLRSGRERDFYLAVAACSLATGAKYNGVFLFAVLPLVWLLAFGEVRSRRFLRALGVSLAIAPLPFLATTPYFLLDHAAFMKDWDAARTAEWQAFHTDGVGVVGFFKHWAGFSVGFFSPVSLALVAGWSVVVSGAWARRLRSFAEEKPLLAKGVLVLVATLLLALGMTASIGILQSRHFLPASLLLAVLFLLALHAADAPRARVATIALLVVFNVANAWAHVAAFPLSSKARAGRELEPLEGRTGVIALRGRTPFEPGALAGRADVFLADAADLDVASYDEFLAAVSRFFAERRPRRVVLERIIFEWPVFRPKKDAKDFGARLRHRNPGAASWDACLARAGYRRARTIESCEGPLALRWLLGSFYLGTAEGLGGPVYIYEREG